MATDVERTRKFTADAWERMVELGIFREDERLELIDGGESVTPAAFPDVEIRVDDVFA